MSGEFVALPKVTRYLVVGLTLSYVACLIGGSAFLARVGLIPAHAFLLRTYPWVLLTGFLVENNVLLLALALTVLVMLGSKVEAEWGTRRYAYFLLLALLSASVSTVAFCAFLYSHGNMSMFQCFTGFFPGVMALAVATWQRCPDDAIFSRPFPPLRARQLPFVFLLLALCGEAFFGPPKLSEEEAHDAMSGDGTIYPGSDFYPALVSWYASWFFLRFVANGGGGDPSQAFAFHMQFPLPLRVFALFLSATCFPLVRLCGYGAAVSEVANSNFGGGLPEVVSRGGGADALLVNDASGIPINIASGGGGGAVGAAVGSPAGGGGAGDELRPLMGSTLLEASRRRQAALAALAERLERQKLPGGGTPTTPPSQPAALVAAGSGGGSDVSMPAATSEPLLGQPLRAFAAASPAALL